MSHRIDASLVVTRVRDLMEALLGPFASWPNDMHATPERVARHLSERCAPEPMPKITLFEGPYSDMVLVRDIKFDSLCSHHLLPFFGVAHVAYIPDGRVVGLSKIPRIVRWAAGPPQMQEQATAKIADALFDSALKPKGVLVTLEARHMCMEFRGVRAAEAPTITTAIRGSIDKAEVLSSMQLHRG